MKIKYIIDTPYEGKFTITNVNTGLVRTLPKVTGQHLIKVKQPEVFFSAKADVALRSVDQKEIFPGTLSALASL
jgi:hypothetical protein